jgi:hypothetical protein
MFLAGRGLDGGRRAGRRHCWSARSPGSPGSPAVTIILYRLLKKSTEQELIKIYCFKNDQLEQFIELKECIIIVGSYYRKRTTNVPRITN